MPIFRAILAILLFLVPPLWAGQIDFRGNHLFSSRSLADISRPALERGNIERALSVVQAAYLDEGYLFARFRTEWEDSLWVVEIQEGPRAKWGKVRIVGACALATEEARDILQAEPELPFVPRRLEENIKALLERYDELGFPFAQVWIDSISVDDEHARVDLRFYLLEGEEKLLKRVSIKGLKKTTEKTALELARMETGVPYRGGELHRAVARLRGAGVFASVGEPLLKLSADGRGVEVEIGVEEVSSPSSFAFALGYADAEGSAPRTLSGLAVLELRNIGGTLRDLGVSWRNDGRGRSQTAFSFSQRFFFGLPLSLKLALEQAGLDTLYTWQSLGLEAGYPMGVWANTFTKVYLAVHGDRNVFSSGDILRSWRLRLGLGVDVVWTSHRFSSRGEARMTVASKKSYFRGEQGGQNVRQYILSAGMGIKLPLVRRLTYSQQVRYQGLESSEAEVPLSEQFYLGGAASLRGYRENQFHGTTALLSRSELFVGSDLHQGGYLFLDAGYIDGGPSTGIARLGAGFGLRTASQAGDVDLSFGVGEKLSLRQTKVHVMLNRRF